MAVTITDIPRYENFGHCLQIANEKVEVIVSLSFGPRILHCSLIEQENLFWLDTERAHGITAPGLNKAYGRGDVYQLMGGHRLWASPEHTLYSYFPDTDPVTYRTKLNGAVFTPPERPLSGEQHSMEVTLHRDHPEITVVHRIKNMRKETVKLAPWAITQLKPGGVEIIPQSRRETGLLPDRLFAIWPYTDMGDKRLFWGEDYITLHPETITARPLKIGMHNRDGWALYLNGNTAFHKRFHVEPEGCYPDFGMSYETYCNNAFCELESLGELKTLAHGETASHTEVWTLAPCKLLPGPRDKKTITEAVALFGS